MRQATNFVGALAILMAGFLVQAPCLAEGLTFDAASVKLFGPDVPKVVLFSGGPDTADQGRLHLRVNMSILLGAAFGVGADQVKGPAWLRDFSAGSTWLFTTKQGASLATISSSIRVVQE